MSWNVEAPGVPRRTAVLVIGCLLVLGYFAVHVTIDQASSRPVPAPAHVSWGSQGVTVSAARPMIRGQLLITAKQVSDHLRVGLSAGVPSASRSSSPPSSPGGGPNATFDPAGLLSTPQVQMAVPSSSFHPSDCLAPCELELPSTFDCSSGTCRLTFEVTLRLVSAGDGLALPVTVAVAGGLDAPSDERLPEGLEVRLILDGAAFIGGTCA